MDERGEDSLDVADDAVWPLQSDYPCHEREERAEQEEIYKRFVQIRYAEPQCIHGVRTVINLARRELSLWTNDSPDETRSSEHFCIGTDETAFLSWAAHIWNVGKHPRLHTELYSSGDDSSYDLTCTAVSHRTHDGKVREIIYPRTSSAEEFSCSDQA